MRRWAMAWVLGLGACGAESPGGAGDTEGSSGDTGPTNGGTTDVPATTTDATGTIDEGTTTSGADDEPTASSSTAADTQTSGGDDGPAAACFADDFVNEPDLGPDYDQFMPIVGSHCKGTNHQAIEGVERVVFLGDSVTVGTPPTGAESRYRTLVADALAAQFGLSTGSEFERFQWITADVFNGTSIIRTAGDFWSCAKWGARNDDLLQDSSQIVDCFPQETWDQSTLVIMTSGSNDISNLTQNAINGATQDELWAQAMDMVQLKREAVQWIVDRERFPNGNYVVFGNIYEFTDGTGEVESCDVSGLAGFDEPVPAPDELAEVVIWILQEYLSIAVETGTDMVFMFEGFCGHGFNHDNPRAPCYRGPGAELWFDLTCIHPNATGHGELADMFLAVVNE